MSMALIAASHSPLLVKAELPPAGDIQDRVEQAFGAVRKFAHDYQPTLLVIFAPDHYNGFFQDLMPPFCIGTAARAVGDYDTLSGPVSVREDYALDMVEYVQKQGIDMPYSRAMVVDHGVAQPLEELFGTLSPLPIIPVFVNGVAPPWVPVERIRRMGQAVGSYLETLDERVLVIASGGLSHDPPLPRWDETDDAGREFLLEGRNPTPEFRAARQANVIKGAAAFARGLSPIIDLNPAWDSDFMDRCASGDPTRFDTYSIEEMTREAGHSVHECRTWVGAFSALSAAGPYDVSFRFYEPIREFIAGFGIMSAQTKA